MKRRFGFLFLVIIIIAIMVGSFFRKELFLAYAQYKIHRFCKKELGAHVTIDSISYVDKKVIINNITLCKEGHFEWRVNQAIVDAHFDFKKGHIFVDLALDNAIVVHKRETLCNFFPSLPTFFPWIKFTLHSAVQKGELLLYDYRPYKTFFQRVSFQLDNVYTHKGGEGVLSLQLEEGPHWNLHFTNKKNEGLSLRSQFQSHHLQRITDLIHYVFDDALPSSICSWQVQKGFIEGHIEAKFIEKELSLLSGALSLKEMEMVDPHYSLAGRLTHFHSEFALDFHRGPEMWSASCKLTEGFLSLKEGSSALWNHLFDITQLSAEIVIDQGSVVCSSMSGQLMGMQGKMNIHFGASDKLMRAFFTGSSSQIVPLLPPSLQEAFALGFAEDIFSLNAVVRRAGDGGVRLEGSIDITDATETNTIEFGCHLKKEPILSKLDEFPSFLPRALASFLENMKTQFYLNNQRVGWLRANNLTLEKYLSPFLFKDTRFSLTGAVNVEASFDEKGIVFFYEGGRVVLENPSIKLTVDRIAERSFTDIVALHFIDLETFTHKGVLPLKGATYLQKNVDLNFTECEGLVTFENNKIRVEKIHTNCEEVDFLGELLLEIRSLTDIELYLQTDKIACSYQAGAHFLSHITPSAFWQLPIAGEIESGHKGCYLQFHFSPLAKLVDARVEGTLRGALSNAFFALEEIDTDFHYQQGDHSCSFTRSSALYKSILHKRPYSLRAPLCKLSHFPQTRWEVVLEAFDDEGIKRVIRAKSDEEQRLSIHSNDFPAELAIHLGLGSLQESKVPLTFEYGKVHADGVLEREDSNYLVKDLSLFHEEFGELSLKSASAFQFQKAALELPEITFTLRQEGLQALTHYFLSRGIDFDFSSLVKEKGALEGMLSCKVEKDLLDATLLLKGGELSLYNYYFPLERLQLHYEPHRWQLSSPGTLFGHPCYVQLERDIAAKDMLISIFSNQGTSSLITTWQREENEGPWRFRKGAGSFGGMNGEIESLDGTTLQGEISFQPQQVAMLLPSEIGNYLTKKNIEGHYLFKGEIVPSRSSVDLVGTFSGRECSYDSIRCAYFSSHIKKIGEKIEATEIEMQDRAGSLRCKQLLFDQAEGRLILDKLVVEKLRLASIRSKWTPQLNRRPFRSLVISHLNIDHLGTNINNIDSSIAEGQLTFTNLPRRTFLNQLFFLPMEITARLGLDIANFIPIRGKVSFAMREGKIVLQEFNDMYSEGKRSLFYLATGLPSFIDFSGNVNIYIKMKQYTLLMKLAESLTLSVKGTLQKPSFTFMSQVDD